MIDSIRVIDNFCPEIERVRQSALDSGFGSWDPKKGALGSSHYAGMNFWGEHSLLLVSLAMVEDAHVFPNSMFFRVTRPGMEKAYTHSDRETGARTCIVYLSEHAEPYGTGFYRHKETGLDRMPTFEEMAYPEFDQLKSDMIESPEDAWEQVGYIAGKLNRAVIFDAPLFHSRLPKDGLGSTDTDSRMVWAAHYHTPNTLER